MDKALVLIVMLLLTLPNPGFYAALDGAHESFLNAVAALDYR
jgi:hypothetical protein